MPIQAAKDISRAAVVDVIRQSISNGELVPGQRLVESEICESLEASRGTVRLALTDLVHEGLVEHIPNRGARVRIVSLEEALQIAEVRLAVESLCVARAAEAISDPEIKELRAILPQMVECAERGDVMAFADLTHLAFDIYVRVANQPVAEEILLRLRARNNRHRFRLTYRAERPRVALPLWRDIIESICRRDPEGAKRALERHSDNVREAMKAIADEQNPLRRR